MRPGLGLECQSFFDQRSLCWENGRQERDLHYAYWALNGDAAADKCSKVIPIRCTFGDLGVFLACVSGDKAGDDETFGLLMQDC